MIYLLAAYYKVDLILRKHARKMFIASMMPVSPFAFFLNGLLMFLWGAWVAAPWDAFDTATFYMHLDNVFPEPVWGVLSMAGGVVKLWGAYKMNERALTISSLVGFFVWGVLAAFYWSADWTAPGSVIMTFLWLNATWHYLNLRVMGVEKLL